MPIDPSSFTEFGLAGLFGVFALVLTTMFLKFIRDLLEAEREARTSYMKDLNENLIELNRYIRKLNGAK